jgi:hypothetical protein
MKKLNYILTITATLTALAVQTSSAQPTGSITNLVTDSANKLWDFSRLTNDLQTLQLDIQKISKGDTNTVTVVYSDPFIQNGAGKLVGSGTNAQVQIIVNNDSETNTFTGKYTTSGAISGSKGVTKVSFLSKVSGKVTFFGDTKATAVSASANYVVKFDTTNPTNQVYSGRAIQQATAAGKGSLSEVTTIDPAPIKAELGDGSWALALNFIANTNKVSGNATNKLSGTASVTLATGDAYKYNFTGIYAPKTKQSKLVLKGTELAKGSTLQVTLQTNAVAKITGKVAGQLVNVQ